MYETDKPLVTANRTPQRFQKFKNRQFASVLRGRQLQRTIFETKSGRNRGFRVHWRGIPMLKDPFTLALYSNLLWELRPRTIIEVGAFRGGSACWLADMASAMGLESKVTSFDLEPPTLPFYHGGVTFEWFDARSPEAEIARITAANGPRPLLIIEDVHVETTRLLSCLFGLLEAGDYLVVEDTCDPEKHEALALFLEEREEALLVDTLYTDAFGYNATWNWNSFLVRTDAASA